MVWLLLRWIDGATTEEREGCVFISLPGSPMMEGRKGLEHQTPDQRAWVRCPMPPNTLRVHTEYVLVESVGSEVLWVVAAKPTGAGDWRVFPTPPIPCLNWGDRDRWCLYQPVEVQTVSGSVLQL
ncbi:hypothetical protein TNCV_2857141 [Trichonephila clavipes]|nr:hypothetical protein TNCV_2857141 [Trichonephila clavipes]